MEYRGFPTADELRREQTEGANMVGALVYGLVAGAIGAAIWFAIVVVTNYQVGLLAVIIGALVGTGVMIGSGRKRNMRLQLLSVVLTLAAMAGAEYFIVRHFVVEYLVQQGTASAADVPLFFPLDLAWEFVVAAVQDDPLTLVFWGIAVWTAFRVPAAPRISAIKAPAAPVPPA
jgi:hypothetical protein